MSLTDTTRRDDVSARMPGVSLGTAAAVEAIDRALFTTPSFTISAANERVTAHRTVALARASVRAGHAATYVATVRPGVVAVDVDLDDDDEAAAVLAAVISWCDEHSVWSLARRSGGGAGRWHLFAVPGDLEPLMVDVVESARRAHRLDGRQVDVRTTIRPLGAAHRLTGDAGVPDDVERAARDLEGAARQPTSDPCRRRRRAAEDVEPRPALAHPIEALPVRFWEDVARPHPRGTDRSRAEFAYTVSLVRAGFTEDDAWRVVADPAHAGMVRSRRRGRAWWRRYSWNAVERPADATPLVRRTGVSRTLWEGPYDWTAVVLPAAHALRQVWHRWPTRQRHTIDHVLAVIADRFTRRGMDPLPLSLRSLVEDTGLALNTVRAAVSGLIEVELLRRLEGEANTDGTRAYVYELNAAMLTRPVATDTPSIYTPAPADPLWLGSPAGTLSHWLSLHLDGAHHQPSRHQATTCAAWLHHRGLTQRTGTPRALPPNGRVPRPRAGLRAWSRLRRRHAHERQEYRATLARHHEQARKRWETGRHWARAIHAHRDQQRQQQWWGALAGDERDARTAHMRAWYAGLCPADQERRRRLLDERRALATEGRALSERGACTPTATRPSVLVATAAQREARSGGRQPDRRRPQRQEAWRPRGRVG